MKSYPLLFLFLFCALQAAAQKNSFHRVQLTATPEQVRKWSAEGILPPHFHYSKSVLEMEVDQQELRILKKNRIRYTDITRKTRSRINENLPGQQRMQSAPVNFSYGSMGGYYTYQEIMDVLDSMRSKFPALVSQKDTIGATYEGRPIVMIRISDHPDSTEAEEDEWLMTSLHHANEVMGMSVSVYYAWYLLEHYNTDKEIMTLLNNSVLHLVAVVNPDGLVYNESTNPSGGGTWRKNRKPRVIGATTHYGVDLNRNYGYKWAYTHAGQLGQAGSNFAGNAYYRGLSSWSEEETQAIRNLCNAHRFTAAFNYHAWDDSFNYPWNFDIDSLTSDSAKFRAIAEYCTEESNFETGTFDQTLGYTANGTSDDWMYGEQTTKEKIFSFTIEVGKSFWPAQSLIVTYCDSLLHANLKMLRMAAKYAAINETSAGTVNTLTVQSYYNLKRYSIKDTGFTVSLIPLDAHITSVGPSKQYTDLGFLETRPDSIVYTISPTTPNGTVFRFLLQVDNGAWSYVDTISKVFMGQVILPLGCDDDVEPDNTMLQARTISIGERTVAAIASQGDEDWFYFTNTRAKTNARIILSGLPVDYDLELFDAAGQRLDFSANPHKINDTIVFNTNTTGGFRVRVYGFNKAWHPFGCYFIEVQLSHVPYAEVSHYELKNKGKGKTIIVVSPVPAKDHLDIAMNASESQQVTWFITDNMGRQLYSGTRTINIGSSNFSLDIHKLPHGFYVLGFVMDHEPAPVVFKIIKE